MAQLETPSRRQRPQRAAAPKKSMEDSDGEYVPEDEYKLPATSSATKTNRKSTRGDESGYETSRSSSNSSIPAVPVNTKQTAQPSLSPQKRAIGEGGDMSPSKKNRKIILTTNKKSSEKPHALPETEAIAAFAQGSQLPPAIQADRQSLEATKKTLISMCASINTSVNSLQSAQDLRDANEKIASLEAQLKTALASQDPEDQTRLLQEKVNAGLKREDELRATLEDLKLKNKATREFCDELRREVAELDKKDQHLNLHTEKVTDDQIEHAWLQIAHEIQNFVLQVLTRNPHRVPAPREANQHEVEALKKMRKKVGPKLETFYYQKHIWDRIFKEIFLGESNVWGGPGGQAFHRFCLDIGELDFEGMEEFSRIKAHVGEYLTKCSDAENAANIKKIINDLKNELFVFTNPELEDSVTPRLGNIVRRAVVMNYTLLKSRAFFLPSRVLDEYDEEDLDIRFTHGDSDGEPEIDLQISPMIRKIGDADGHDFDECSIVCKPLVMMKRV